MGSGSEIGRREGDLTPRMGSSGACARPAKTDDDAMVGKAWREESASAAEEEVLVVVAVRAEEGSRWRTSVLNLRSALGCAPRTLADGIVAQARVRRAREAFLPFLARSRGGNEAGERGVGGGSGVRNRVRPPSRAWKRENGGRPPRMTWIAVSRGARGREYAASRRMRARYSLFDGGAVARGSVARRLFI